MYVFCNFPSPTFHSLLEQIASLSKFSERYYVVVLPLTGFQVWTHIIIIKIKRSLIAASNRYYVHSYSKIEILYDQRIWMRHS